jgi:gas vesicle protein
MKQAYSFFLGALVGGLVGATIAILFTPASGENLRFQIQERSIQLKDEIKSVAEERRAELERELAALRTPVKKELP